VWVTNVLTDLHTLETNEPLVFLVGGAVGVQEGVVVYCKSTLTDYVLFKPWHLVDPRLAFVPRFFFMRNKQIIDNADRVIILTDGTEDSEVDRAISYAEKRNKDLTVFTHSDAGLSTV